MKQIKLVVQGFIVGLGKIIPGVSGGMLAMSMGIYEELINAIAHFFSDIKKHVKIIGLVGMGAMISIVSMSKIIEYALDACYLPTMLLFIGLMMGGFPPLKKQIEGTSYKKYLPQLLIPFFSMVFLHYVQSETIFIFDGSFKSIFYLFLFGIIDAITMVIPGMSGTAILMLLGCYTMLLETFGNMFNLSLFTTTFQVLCPFGMGVFIGIIITIQIVAYLLKYHSISFHYTILSFFLSSIFLLFVRTLNQNYSIPTIMIGVCLFVIGYGISSVLDQ